MTRGQRTAAEERAARTDRTTLTVRAPDPRAFAPYGAFLEPPREPGARTMFGDWLAPVSGRTQHCHINRVRPSTLPLTLDRVERHPQATQLFVPMGVSRYLVTVLPSDANDTPDPTRALAFVVPGSVGVAYRPGTWHAGIAVLDAEASFAVMMWRGGTDDDEFASIPPLELRPVPSAARGDAHA